jgi:DNA-binding transcriptional LysR family regulator
MLKGAGMAEVLVRDVLTPEAIGMVAAVHRSGSMAAAARGMGMVPSAITYRVRQLEDALDVLLFDRSSRQARLTAAGHELLREGQRLLGELDSVANRVRRIATGWETQLTIAVDSIVARATVMELCEKFFALQPPTRLKLRDEVLSGTLQALLSGQADLALGVMQDFGAGTAGKLASATLPGDSVKSKPLGPTAFVYAVAPHHRLAREPGPLTQAMLRQHRVVAVADSVPGGDGITVGLLGGQDVFTVPGMLAKVDAQVRGLGAGFLPETLARPLIDAGRLVEKKLATPPRVVRTSYAWRSAEGTRPGRALQWWLAQLEHPATRRALLDAR